MSYSVNVTKPTKAELETAIGHEFLNVLSSQPAHASDIGQALAATKSLIGLMRDDPARDLSASVSGSIWKKDDGVENVSLSVALSYAERSVNKAE